MMRIALIILMFALASAGGFGAVWLLQPRAADILITNGVAASIEDQPDSIRVYFRIENAGGPDRLISASSSFADQTVLYSPESDDGIPVPASSQPSLAVDGAHVVLSGLADALQDGQLIPVTLTFEQAGPVSGRARYSAESTSGANHIAGLFGFGGICAVGEGEPAPAVSLSAQISDGGLTVDLQSDEFTFREDLLDGPHVPGTGHGHLYVGGLKLQRLFGSRAEIGALPPGSHVVRVTLNTNDHRAYVVEDEPVTATTTIHVN